jgi:hypothetical protein
MCSKELFLLLFSDYLREEFQVPPPPQLHLPPGSLVFLGGSSVTAWKSRP